MKRIVGVLFSLLLPAYGRVLYAQQPNRIDIACLGASITAGATLEHGAAEAYPQLLQQLLGNGYHVQNYGVNGTTLLRNGDKPYWKTGAYKAALQSRPDIVFIDLGGNDSKGVNRGYLDEFESDYHDLIQSFRRSSHPRIILLLPLPCFLQDTTQINDQVITSAIIPRIREIAYAENLEVLDMHSLFIDMGPIMPDKIHPNAEGAHRIADRLYTQLTLKADPSFDISGRLAGNPSRQVGSFYGYKCADLTFHGRGCKIVQPKYPAVGRPWIWRARFWGHEPQTDIALLERGYHLVYCDVSELFGNSEAIADWNAFYGLLHQAGLADKAVMEGMSRGGVYVLNWAAVNPDKVACAYLDNPVLDLKSWPGGLGRYPAAGNELAQLMADYRLKDSNDLRNFSGSPIDKIEQIAKGGYPILILCADADEAVAPEENTVLFRQKMEKAGGKVTVLFKHGFHHHPHSLPDPKPIVDFILNSDHATASER